MRKNNHQRERKRAHERILQEAERVRPLTTVSVAADQQAISPNASQSERRDKKEIPMESSETSKQISWTDKCLAVFTGFLVVVAIYQIVVTNSQLSVMRNDQRAWLKFDVISDASHLAANKTGFTLTSGQPISVPIRITNVGKTPALKADAVFFIDLLSVGQTVDLPTGDEELQSVGHPAPKHCYCRQKVHQFLETSSVFPAETREEVLIKKEFGTNGTIETKILTVDELVALRDGKSGLVIWGQIWYSDVFGHEHWTRFCTIPTIEIHAQGFEECAKFSAVDSDK